VPGFMPTFIASKVTCQMPGTGMGAPESLEPAFLSTKNGRKSSMPW